MKVLLSGHGEDRAALDAARRAVAHRQLILFSSRPHAPDLAVLRESEDLAGVKVEVHAVDAADLMGCLQSASKVLEREARSDVRVHVAGGPNLVTSALLLAAFKHGREAFYCHARGMATLPVAFESKLEDKISATDRNVLITLPPRGGEIALEALRPPNVEPGAVKGALLRLRKAGLVHANQEIASLTQTGRYYREQFARMKEASP